MTNEPFDDSDLAPATVPRRWLLRALTAATVGVGTIVGLTGCGGGGGEGEEDEEDDD